MIDCVYCHNPLICETCGANYMPRTPEEYEAMSWPEEPVVCHECEQIVVCHWCGAAYSGDLPEQPDSDEPGN